MDTNGQNGNPRDRPRLKERLTGWMKRWGADVMLTAGAGCISAGAGLIYLPAGMIVAGVLLIIGGVLCARGGDGS